MQEDQLSSICKEYAGKGGEALAAAASLPWSPPCTNMVLFWRSRGTRYLLVNNGKVNMYRLKYEHDTRTVSLKRLNFNFSEGGGSSKEAYLLYREHVLQVKAGVGYKIKQI